MHQISTSERPSHPNLSDLAFRLSQCKTAEDKIALFVAMGYVLPNWHIAEPLSCEAQVVLFSIGAIDQGDALGLDRASPETITELIEELNEVEAFYGFLGGIVGYHSRCIELIGQKAKQESLGVYHKPNAHECGASTEENRLLRLSALRNLDQLAEIYPIGGAADRLSQRSSQIAANRLFCEKTLLERLIEDVKAKEDLAKRLFNLDVTIPVVLMTSDEKNGTQKVGKLLEESKWFGRDPEAFFLVSQPLVPAMTSKGKWIATAPGKPLLKPGGHGALWKVCRDQGALEWLKGRGVTKVLARQINNPVAGVDDGLYTFIGYAFDRKKDFGFASCPRKSGVAEGVNVVIKAKGGYTLTNIEYCDFERYGVGANADLLANTNLLFVDIKAIEELLEKIPIPGMLINAKEMSISSGEKCRKEVVLRLESTMQNLADGLISPQLPTRAFITTNRRQKTISPIKIEGGGDVVVLQTPEQCFCDMQKNAEELLCMCGITVGFKSVFEYHPSLGPFYCLIRQKLRGGELADHSFLNLQIAEVDISRLHLDGAFSITAQELTPGKREGKCVLADVRVINRGRYDEGISRLASFPRVFEEQLCIVIEEGGEFVASGVTFKGGMEIRVPRYTRVVATMEGDRVKLHAESITLPSWQWRYHYCRSGYLTLIKHELSED